MDDYTVFPNAPITEALLDVRVFLPKDSTVETLGKMHDAINIRFPGKGERSTIHSGINIARDKEEISLSSSRQLDGHLFKSVDGSKIVQSRIDGFTFNKLKPYESWQKFSEEAREIWGFYCDVAKPLKIVRLGLRYINRIELPLPFGDFREYILTYPEIAPSLPQALSHFFMRVEVINEEIPAVAVITETIDKPTKSMTIPLIFDIDVIKETDYPSHSDNIWNDFEKMREFKNDIFFKSLTDKAKELFT
jgi:uncharacterized protein (TIGR04255 family)